MRSQTVELLMCSAATNEGANDKHLNIGVRAEGL